MKKRSNLLTLMLLLLLISCNQRHHIQPDQPLTTRAERWVKSITTIVKSHHRPDLILTQTYTYDEKKRPIKITFQSNKPDSLSYATISYEKGRIRYIEHFSRAGIISRNSEVAELDDKGQILQISKTDQEGNIFTTYKLIRDHYGRLLQAVSTPTQRETNRADSLFDISWEGGLIHQIITPDTLWKSQPIRDRTTYTYAMIPVKINILPRSYYFRAGISVNSFALALLPEAYGLSPHRWILTAEHSLDHRGVRYSRGAISYDYTFLTEGVPSQLVLSLSRDFNTGGLTTRPILSEESGDEPFQQLVIHFSYL